MIKAENSSTLCKFHEGRKRLRSMGSNVEARSRERQVGERTWERGMVLHCRQVCIPKYHDGFLNCFDCSYFFFQWVSYN